MPVPALSFATRYYNCNAGIMVTASHNPAKYNGYPSVSALVINTVNAVDALTENVCACEQDSSGSIKFKFSSDSDEQGQLLIRALDMGLSNIEKEYGKKYLQVHYKEV